MPTEFYLALHLLGLACVVYSFGYAIAIAQLAPKAINRKLLFSISGLGLVILLVAGMGLVATLQIPWPWPLWIWLKLLMWFFAPVLVSLIVRKPEQRKLWGTLVIVFVLLVVYLGVYKP